MTGRCGTGRELVFLLVFVSPVQTKGDDLFWTAPREEECAPGLSYPDSSSDALEVRSSDPERGYIFEDLRKEQCSGECSFKSETSKGVAVCPLAGGKEAVAAEEQKSNEVGVCKCRSCPCPPVTAASR